MRVALRLSVGPDGGRDAGRRHCGWTLGSYNSAMLKLPVGNRQKIYAVLRSERRSRRKGWAVNLRLEELIKPGAERVGKDQVVLRTPRRSRRVLVTRTNHGSQERRINGS